MTTRSLLLVLIATVLGAAEGVVTETVDYAHGDVQLQGFLARPAELPDGGAPGVLVVHEWWGMNDYAKRRAEELAAQGYVAFALDMYGAGKRTDDPEQAKAWSAPFYQDPALGRARALAGLEQLRRTEGVDAERIGAIGFCFGGSVVLNLATAGADLDAVVSLHGGLAAAQKAEPGAVQAAILVLHGGSDDLVPPAQVAGFMQIMEHAQADWRLVVYGGAEHAFTNPNADEHEDLPVAYDEDAAARAMRETVAFLDERVRDE